MFTYSYANTPLGQSERAYYLSYFINSYIYTQTSEVLMLEATHKLAPVLCSFNCILLQQSAFQLELGISFFDEVKKNKTLERVWRSTKTHVTVMHGFATI